MNYNPLGGSSWTLSTDSNPCPICSRTHDNNCIWSGDGKTVCCHTRANPNSSVPQPLDRTNGYVFTGKIETKGVLERAVYVLDDKDDFVKASSKSGKKQYIYTDSNGIQIVRVNVSGTGKQKMVWQEFWIEDDRLAKFRSDDFWVKVSDTDLKKSKAAKTDRELYLKLSRELYPHIHLYQIGHPTNKAAIVSNQPILIVEGESSVECLLSLNIAATTAIGGAGKLRMYGFDNYISDLDGFSEFVMCPDRDKPGMDHATEFATHLQTIHHGIANIKWLYADPTYSAWNNPAKGSGYDVKNWVEKMRSSGLGDAKVRDLLLGAIEGRREIQVAAEKAAPKTEAKKDDRADDRDKSQQDDIRLVKEYRWVQSVLKDRLRLNTLTNTIELDGQSFSLEHIKLDLAIDHGVQLHSGEEAALAIIQKLAKTNQYNPVLEYLNHVHEKHGDSTDVLQDITDRYFGVSDPIYFIFLVKTLIAAVARTFEPGCKHDEALILQGSQGVGKSSFFRILCGSSWFDDSMGGSTNDKDEVLKLHRCWFMEWGELESVFRRKEISTVKSFLASQKDIVRPPYGRVNIELPRRSVIVGSTNQDEFLNDATGNRRFWVIPVIKQVDQLTLESERDRIWAAAVALYKADLKERQKNPKQRPAWDLTNLEKAAAAIVAEQYQSQDPWFTQISNYTNGLNTVTIHELLNNALKIDLGKQDKASQIRVADTLKQLGWESKRVRVDGKQVRSWVRQPSQTKTTDQEGVVSPETLDISNFFLTETTKTSNNQEKRKQVEESFSSEQSQEKSKENAKFQNQLSQVVSPSDLDPLNTSDGNGFNPVTTCDNPTAKEEEEVQAAIDLVNDVLDEPTNLDAAVQISATLRATSGHLRGRVWKAFTKEQRKKYAAIVQTARRTSDPSIATI